MSANADPFGGHVGQWLDVDGEPVHMLAAPDMSAEARAALQELVRRVRRMLKDESTEAQTDER